MRGLKLTESDTPADIQQCSSRELTRALGLNVFLLNRFITGGVIPTMQSISSINHDVSRSLLETVKGNKRLLVHLQEMSARFRSGVKYEKLIGTLGRELFGSAQFDGEQLLAENDYYTLSYLPPKPGVERRTAALFHAGGFLPYSDRIFRFLPESNLFAPFLERGVAVYAMELKGDKEELRNLGSCTLERHIDMISAMSAIAMRHNEGNKLMLEGYCGLGMQALCYLAAKPQEAESRFNVAFTMVSPIDGKKCETLDELISTVPRSMLMAQHLISEVLGGYVSGDSLRAGMDLPLGAFFYKWPLGRFTAGWKNSSYGGIRTIEELSPSQRKEMAGAYWISPENSRRFPMPVDLSRFSSRLWIDGIVDDHRIPHSYKGQPLSLKTIRDNTRIELAGFFGGRDSIVPDTTAHVLRATLKQRYTHVIHPKAGHISYVLSPELYDSSHAYAFDPNPIDLVLSLYDKRARRQTN